MENQNQKVFINPKFNKFVTHLNKDSSPNMLRQNVRKIFVNPKFMSNNKSINTFQSRQESGIIQHNMLESYAYCYPSNSLCLNSTPNVQSSTCNIAKSHCHEQVCQNNEKINNSMHPSVKKSKEICSSTSKYTLIRKANLVPTLRKAVQNVNQETQKQDSVRYNIIHHTTVPQKNTRYCIIRNNRNVKQYTSYSGVTKETIKVSKYKIITMSTLKNELKIDGATNKFSYESVKPKTLVQKNITLNSNLLKHPNQEKYKYKNVEGSHKKVKSDAQEVKLNTSIRRKSFIRSFENKRPRLNGKYKINNIPCPLYVKYGRCLRKSKGKCDYLHNRKHVSLCRKFIKGLCHDSNCFLSHELSDKKMPTCYFYLKGICSKENCPYLHVKLGSKTRICQEFLKGYCDKGGSCLERHVTLPFRINKKRLQKEKQLKKTSTDTDNVKNGLRPSNSLVTEKMNTEESDKRYFKDGLNENAECEAIKPVRCKLGILPSYIQLL